MSRQVQQERDELYRKFTAAILEVQQKVGFKNLILERKLQALSAVVEKKEVQLSEVLAASNMDPEALTLVSQKLEVGLQSPFSGRPHLYSACHFGGDSQPTWIKMLLPRSHSWTAHGHCQDSC